MDQPSKLTVKVYTPESKIRNPGALLLEMFRSLGASRELAWRLFIRDISAQYRQSMFGVFWAFLPPIVTGMVFILLQSRGTINLGKTAIPFPVYVLSGTILWQIFVESLNTPIKTVLLSKSIVVKVNIPYEALILAAFYMIVFSATIKLSVLTIILLIYKVPFTVGTLYGLLGILGMMVFGIGLGVLITPFGLLYTDVTASLPILVQLWFFITPVVYVLPNSLLANLNPVAVLLTGTRDLITQGVIYNFSPFVVVYALGFLILFIAWIIYRVSIPILIERIGS